jgi:hypothetical protein
LGRSDFINENQKSSPDATLSGGLMPHLQFEINQNITDAAKISLAEQVRQPFQM